MSTMITGKSQLIYHKDGCLYPLVFTGTLEITQYERGVYIKVFNDGRLTDGVLIGPGEYFKVNPDNE